MDWSAEARRVIGEVHATLPPNCTMAERKAALRAAYPFGERAFWPYKAWCKAQKSYLAKFAPQPPVKHLSPLERLMAKAKAADPQDDSSPPEKP